MLDIVPLPYSMPSREFATQYYHWFFLIQPAPFPETLIGNSAEFYLRSRFARPTGGTSAIAPEAFAEYARCWTPETIHATCEDYRAGATIDIEHAAADGNRKVTCPLLVLWGERGTVGRLYDVMSIWRQHATNVRGKALPSGHFLPEEVPDATLSELLPFLTERA
jgi:haloacetate dehalogenase